MIRKRIPSLDDKKICTLIEKELFPYTRNTFPNVKFNKNDEEERLKAGFTYVISKDNRPPIGFILLFIEQEILRIDMLAVERKHQSKGLGSILLLKAERYGRRKGCEISQLYVNKSNVGAQRFYRSKGYTRIRYIPDIQCYLFRKKLKSG